MKSKLHFFLIMFIIWCLFNLFTMEILQKLQLENFHSPYSALFFLTPFVFSAIAAKWPKYFKKVLLFILVTELCLLITLLFKDAEHNPVFIPIGMFNDSFFVLFGYLFNTNGFWLGYYAGRLGIPSLDLGLLIGEMILIGMSVILALAIRKLSMWLMDFWSEEEDLSMQ